MRVLVTGGAGFIGSVTTSALLAEGHDVTVVDDLSQGAREQVPDGARFVEADIGDVAAMSDMIADARFDACAHFAALIDAGASMRHPERFFANNTAASARLLDMLVSHGVQRFVLSSTAAVYGEPRGTPIPEDAPLAPTNAYGESKLLVERMLGWLQQAHGLRWASLRYFNAAGSDGDRGERHDPETHLIPLLLEVAADRRGSLSIFGTDYETPDGTAVRDYVHVRDLADAHVRALGALDVRRMLTCNLGTGSGYSVREVVAAVREVTGHPVPVDTAPRRAGDPSELVADATRARRLLGWRPAHDLHDMVADAWAHLSRHP